MPTSEQKDQNPGKSDQSIIDPNQQFDQIIEKVHQNIGVTDQTNVPMGMINESANSENRQKIIQMAQGSADQAQPMSEGTIIISDLVRERTDQSGSTTTMPNEFPSIPQQNQTNPLIAEQIDHQFGINDNAKPNDQTNFVKPNDQQLVNPRETGQLMPMTGDNLNLASPHEADNIEQFVMIPTPNMRQINAENRVNRKSNSKSGEKTDFGAAESINEASPSTVQRKRGRSKTLKIQEKNAMDKSKIGVEKLPMKSAKGKSKMTESLPIDQADVAIPNRILGMFLYGKGNNKRRAFFVEWDGCETVSPCWVQSDEINALKLVTDFIEKCSIDSVLSAFSGGPVMSHVAKLLEKKAEAVSLMKSIGIQAGKLAKEKIVFSKFTTQMEKDMAIKQKEKFIKSIK
ncbi:hypothetical protein niasHT_023075 [Heterodera trifolii]|uniref:Chromo domain-containing protein n=1 Tax=Heterodera trifolii TaxID=157864 RepID=A0ABD2KF32_9BILA